MRHGLEKNGPTFNIPPNKNTNATHGAGEFAWKVVATSQVQENIPKNEVRTPSWMPHRIPSHTPLAANGQSLFLLSVEDDSPAASHFRTSQVLLHCDNDFQAHSPGLPEAFPHSRPVTNPRTQHDDDRWIISLLISTTFS